MEENNIKKLNKTQEKMEKLFKKSSTYEFVLNQINLEKNRIKPRKVYTKNEVIGSIILTQILSDKIKTLLSAEQIVFCVLVISRLYKLRKILDDKLLSDLQDMTYEQFLLSSYDLVVSTYIQKLIDNMEEQK